MPRPSINDISELLDEFDGSEDSFSNLERQVRLLCSTYRLDDNVGKILIGARLKKKASKWFHSKPEHLEMTVEDLLTEMRSLYDHRPTTLYARKQFENRIWCNDEEFSEYYHDKVILANRIYIGEEEVVDYLIEGITDLVLRNQARMQRFKTKECLLDAFKGITLRADSKHSQRRVNEMRIKTKHGSLEARVNEPTGRRNDMRCYNCNGFGHVSKHCNRPKRERGTCYRCGEAGHIIANCPQGKERQVTNITEQSGEGHGFMKSVNYKIYDDIMSYGLCLDTLLDTGSPISFIKEKFVPNYIIKTAEELKNRF
jgi:Arginine methyltransferase-interacting protein, contains RING Zn-finger